MVDRIKELKEKGYCVRVASGKEGSYIATHEFAHSFIDMSYRGIKSLLLIGDGVTRNLDFLFLLCGNDVDLLGVLVSQILDRLFRCLLPNQDE